MPKPGSRRPAMVDVARLAGVSHQTVSRVLNDHPLVRPETRHRVVEAIDQLGYHRNVAARALATNRTRMLGVLSFATNHYGPASTLHSIGRAARQAHYSVTVVDIDEITRDTVKRGLESLIEYSPDGVVVIAPQHSAFEALAQVNLGVPLVAVEGAEETADVPVVCVDQVEGGRLATDHLLGLGHRTVHHLAGPPLWLEAEGRIEGWRTSLQQAGAPVPEIMRGAWSASSGYETGRELLRLPGLTAVFAANDQMALGLLMACRESGVRVPEDLSVVGFDCIPESGFFAPPLTTVAQDFEEVGRRSIKLLLSMIENADTTVSRSVVPATLVVRGSTAAPRP